MVSEHTSIHQSGPAAASIKEAAALKQRRLGPWKSVLALAVVISLGVGAGLGYASAQGFEDVGATTSGSAPVIGEVSMTTVCQLVSGAMQQQLGIREISPMAEEKGGASCYLLMTEEDAAEPAGFVVAFYPSTASLQQTVDGTDVIPEKAEPLMIEGRVAARQVLYGESWKAQLTVDVGNGAMLYLERFGPKDSLSERELRRSADDLATSILKGRKS
jgi:hypothetical protein